MDVCRLETINTFELDLMAQQRGMRICTLDSFAVSLASGEIFMKGSPEANHHSASHAHYYGTFAAPWFVYNVIIYFHKQYVSCTDPITFTGHFESKASNFCKEMPSILGY